MAQFMLFSWNSPQNHKKTFQFLQKQKCDIICLQETLFRSKDSRFLIQPKIGSTFIFSTNTKQRGMVMFIKPSLSLKLLKLTQMADGCVWKLR